MNIIQIIQYNTIIKRGNGDGRSVWRLAVFLSWRRCATGSTTKCVWRWIRTRLLEETQGVGKLSKTNRKILLEIMVFELKKQKSTIYQISTTAIE